MRFVILHVLHLCNQTVFMFYYYQFFSHCQVFGVGSLERALLRGGPVLLSTLEAQQPGFVRIHIVE